MNEAAPPILNFNAYSPAEIQDAIEKVGVKKANMPFLPSFMLSVVAGGSIGLGALYYTIVASDADLGFAATRVVGGLVFSLGLAIVLVGGAELFTGNNLIVMAWASSKISTREVLRNWLMLQAIGVDVSIFDSMALLIVMFTVGQLPIGPSTGPAATVLILGAHGVASTAAAGVLVTLTGIIGSLIFATWAISDRIATHRRTLAAPPAVAPLLTPPVVPTHAYLSPGRKAVRTRLPVGPPV